MLNQILEKIDEDGYCLVLANEKWYSFVEMDPNDEETFWCTDKEGELYTFYVYEIIEIQ